MHQAISWLCSPFPDVWQLVERCLEKNDNTYLNHFLYPINHVCTHFLDVILDGIVVGNVQGRAKVGVLKKTVEFRFVNLIKGLVTGNNPLCNIMLKSLLIPLSILASKLDQISHQKYRLDLPPPALAALQTLTGCLLMLSPLGWDMWPQHQHQELPYQMQSLALQLWEGHLSLWG